MVSMLEQLLEEACLRADGRAIERLVKQICETKKYADATEAAKGSVYTPRRLAEFNGIVVGEFASAMYAAGIKGWIREAKRFSNHVVKLAQAYFDENKKPTDIDITPLRLPEPDEGRDYLLGNYGPDDDRAELDGENIL